jgi:hypothetical protein
MILVYSMLSVELSIAWLKILLACVRAHARAYVKRIFDRCMGAFINTYLRQSFLNDPYILYPASHAMRRRDFDKCVIKILRFTEIACCTLHCARYCKNARP